MRRLGVMCLTLIVALALPASAQAAKPRGVTPAVVLALSARTVTTGATVTAIVTVRKGVAKQKVTLQRQVGARWVAVRSGTLPKKGRTRVVRLAFAAAWTGTVRLRAVVAKKGKVRAASSVAQSLAVASPPPAGGPTCTGTAPTPVTDPGGVARFHAYDVYACDQAYDSSRLAAIQATIEAADGWFASQTTGAKRPRWDRGPDGSVVVTRVVLPMTRAQLATTDFYGFEGSWIPEDPAVKTVLWVSAPTGVDACGESSFGSAGMRGGGRTVIAEASCDIAPAAGASWPYGATYLLAHEMTHNFGAVADCAPHQGNGGHVTDDPRDLLYAGGQERDWGHLMLDPGHDDYYATGSTSCPGIEGSPWWEG